MLRVKVLNYISPIAYRSFWKCENFAISSLRGINCCASHSHNVLHSGLHSGFTRTNVHLNHHRSLSQNTDGDKDTENQLNDSKMSLIQRFKQSYAIYGKVVIAIHGVGSCFWLGGFYLIASSGFSILELFEAAHFPNWMCNPLRMGSGSVNTWATALVMYKLASPLRYGLTLFLSRYIVRYLRTSGRAPQLADEDRLRNLAREGAKLSGEKFKARMKRNDRKAMNLSKNVRRNVTSSRKDPD